MKVIKKLIRSFLKIQVNETFSDGMSRHYYKLRKKINRASITESEFIKLTKKLNIKKGDVIIIHSSWRGCFSLKMDPNDVLDCFFDLVGKDGTILMPCYGYKKDFFDIENTISNAGVLSEIFRKRNGVVRSEFPDSAMCGYGKFANDILGMHSFSEYAFDKYSPYYIATMKYNAKVILLGMGKNPHKISVFHCASYCIRKKNDFYRHVYTKKMNAIVIGNNGKVTNKIYFDRHDKYKNNVKIFRRLFKRVSKTIICYKKLTLIIFNSIDGFNVAEEFCKKGGLIYEENRYI